MGRALWYRAVDFAVVAVRVIGAPVHRFARRDAGCGPARAVREVLADGWERARLLAGLVRGTSRFADDRVSAGRAAFLDALARKREEARFGVRTRFVRVGRFVQRVPLHLPGDGAGNRTISPAPPHRTALRRAALVVGAMFGFLALAWLLRSHVLLHPYNPPRLKAVHFLRRPFLYWFPGFYKYIPAHQYYPALLALWLWASVGLGLHFQKRMPGRVRRIAWPLGVLVGCLALGASFDGIGESAWYFIEGAARTHISDLIQMIFTLWALSAIWKYRRTQPTLAMLSVFLLVYVPVWTYLGWHYTLAGWFVRAGLWWPMMWHLARLDWLKLPRVQMEARTQTNAPFAAIEAPIVP